jgi:hypothetical protein
MIDTALHLVGAAADMIAALPDPDPTQPPGTDGLITLLNWFSWIVAAICLAGVLAAAGVMAWSHARGTPTGNEGVTRLGWSLVACVVVGAAAAMVGALV